MHNMLHNPLSPHTHSDVDSTGRGKWLGLLGLVIALVVLAGCGNMREQPKIHKPFDPSPTFGQSARVPLPQAVAVSSDKLDEHLYYGTINGELATTYPIEVTEATLLRGQKLFNSFCTPCHGYAGYGDGIVAWEGFPSQPNLLAPASHHSEELRAAPSGRFIQAMVNGKNAMYSFAGRIEAEDRWAIAAYIQTLQFSQNAEAANLPPAMQDELAGLGGEAKEATRVNVSQ